MVGPLLEGLVDTHYQPITSVMEETPLCEGPFERSIVWTAQLEPITEEAHSLGCWVQLRPIKGGGPIEAIKADAQGRPTM